MAKKSCDKHKKFNYYCEDCQAINRITEQRFKYSRFKGKVSHRTLILIIIVIVAIVIALAVFWLWPAWFADISLNSQLYSTKAGGLNYLDFFFLNGWSTKFIFNWTALIGAFLGCAIMSLPPERNLLTLIGTKLRFGKPTRWKSLLFWWTIGFVMFYFLGLLLNLNNGGFSWTIYLIQNGEIVLSPNLILDAFNIIFDKNSIDFETIYIYSNLLIPIITFTMGVIVLRLILNIVKYVYLRRNDYLVMGNVLVIIGLVCGLVFVYLPTLSLDGVNVIQIFSLIFGFFSVTALGAIIYAYGKMQYKKDSKNYRFVPYSQKKLIIVMVIVVVFTVSPLLFSIGPLINLNNTAVWTEQQWTRKYKREVDWTRIAAGLDMFEERPIENFTTSSTSERDLVDNESIRAYDQNYAIQYLATKIGSTVEGLADSDIIYFNNTEYWVAPKTVKFSIVGGDSVATSTELYDHVEGFLAMSSFNGTIVPDVSDIFNVSVDYPIFFGESESRKYIEQTLGYYEEGTIGAYDSDILLYTGWEDGKESLNYKYEAEPDGSLTGLEGFWKTLNLGLLAYSFRTEHEYLINRNIKDRVRNILLPQLKIDNDPYFVFDFARGKLYYAVSIYTSINIGSYSQYPVLRFLGISLIDVLNGEMTFYKNPSLVESSSDPTYHLWKIYMNQYAWQATPPWLKEQLRYPEDLFEQQLGANYIYHVQNPSTWRIGNDFHERPEEGDLFYAESDLGDGIEYVGLDLVEYKGKSAVLLAGMYVIRHGDHFGEAIFYHTRSGESLIGPKTARDTYVTEATQKISLIANARHGNTLLYPLGGSLYYFIPTYSTSESTQDLGLVGFVDALSQDRDVYYNSTVNLAAKEFLPDDSESESNVSIPISYSFGMEDSITYPSDLANFIISLQHLNKSFSAPHINVKVNLSIYSATTNFVDYILILPPSLYPIQNTTYTDGLFTRVNFTIIEKDFYWGEELVLNGFLNTTKGGVLLRYKWNLIIDDVMFYESPEKFIEVILG